MSKAKLANLRNVAVCGHGGSGKTTLVDRLLLKTNAVSGHPSVDDGTSICDFEPEEKHHKHTVEAKLAHFEHGGCHFNIVDTPGYPDFIGQTIGALYGVETAAIVINAHSGIEVNSRRVFNEAAQANLGRVIVVNKMDTDNTDFAALVASFQELWGNACVPLTMPIGQGADFQGVINVLHPTGDTSGAVMPVAEMRERLIESIIEVDEAIMERYFEGDVPSDDELAQLMKRAVAAGTLIPILACSAKNDVGIAELLDFLPACTLAPDQVKRYGTLNGERIELVPDENAPLAARIFKTRVDPFVQKLSFIRVFSGSLHKDSQVHASTARKNIKLGPLLEVQAHDTHPVEEAGPGEIVAVAKIDELHTGTDLGDVVLRRMPFPTPMVGLAVTPKNRGDETKLSGALHKILEEDPTFHLDRDPQTKELVMTGMSEL
ncbi:MAG: GTP-binding protein, partial [Planctomycetales bacterium]|nr:GTP-binding protein [Planctomycetales bacterium]